MKCTKFRHPSQDMAEQHIERLRHARRHRDHPKRMEQLRAYICRSCGYWHVGHLRPAGWNPRRAHGKRRHPISSGASA